MRPQPSPRFPDATRAVRIDAHIHFWRPSCRFDNKPVADHAAYRRDFLPADVAPELDACGIDGMLLVQTCPQAEETDWLLALAASEPRVLGVTGWVDLADAALDFAPLLAHTRLVGIRAQLRRILDPRFVLQPTVLANLGRALNAGLGVTLLAEHRHYAPVQEALGVLPAGPITFNHLGMRFPDVDGGDWRAMLHAIAGRPETFLQLSGLPFLYGDAWRLGAAHAVLAETLELLGPGRLLFASDWPMLARFATYTEWVQTVERLMDSQRLSTAARDAVFAGNALRANPRLAATAGNADARSSAAPSPFRMENPQ